MNHEKKESLENALVFQWLGPVSTAEGIHSTPDGETKIWKAMQHDQKEMKEIENLNRLITSKKTE